MKNPDPSPRLQPALKQKIQKLGFKYLKGGYPYNDWYSLYKGGEYNITIVPFLTTAPWRFYLSFGKPPFFVRVEFSNSITSFRRAFKTLKQKLDVDLNGMRDHILSIKRQMITF